MTAPDLEFGAFSDTPPWLFDPERLAWDQNLDLYRATIRRQVPSLLRHGRLPPGRRVGTVVWHLGRAAAMWSVTGRRRGTSASRSDLSRRMREAVEVLGPTFIKLGQIISSGEGLFPPELVAEFRRCRDQVPPVPFRVVEQTITEEFRRPLDEIFASIDREPLAAASIAQVHRARLLDGTTVVVKVQRPGIAQRVHQDLRAMAWIAPFLICRIPVAALANPPALVEVFAHTISEELDFRLEAKNMVEVAASFAGLGQRGFVIPRPHPTLVTRRVLVMERLEGMQFDDIAGIAAAGVDTHSIIRTGMIGFMEGALVNGIFHGDLHGGNLFVLPDGRTALLDFGITARMQDSSRIAFLRLLMSGTTGNPQGQLAALRDLGALPPDTDLDAVVRDLGLDQVPVDPTTLSAEELVAELQRVVKLLLGYGARMPKELMLFVKNLVFLDGAIATLAPDIDLFAEIAHIAMHFAQTHGDRFADEMGFDGTYEVDMTSIKDAFAVDRSVDTLTYNDLLERRELIKKRLRHS